MREPILYYHMSKIYLKQHRRVPATVKQGSKNEQQPSNSAERQSYSENTSLTKNTSGPTISW